MANTYENPIDIVVEMSPSFTSAALNKCLIITKEHKSEGGQSSKDEIAVFSSSKEVGEYFGNNSKVFKAVEFFLGQMRYPSKRALIPTFFTILSVKSDSEVNKASVLDALNGIGAGAEFYAISDVLEDGELAEGDLNSWINENRKIYFNENTSKTTTENHRSPRLISIYNAKHSDGDSREYKAMAYMATCITPGAGSKSDMNILSMCSADIAGGERQTLTAQNLNFTERRTSKDYILVRTGVGTDGTDITETTALDCIIYNLIDNLEIAMAETGFKLDDRGIELLEDTISRVMGEMYNMGLIADEKGQAAFKILPTVISETDRQLKRIQPRVVFVLGEFAKTVRLTLERTYGSIGGDN